jgi:hypothetical protein
MPLTINPNSPEGVNFLQAAQTDIDRRKLAKMLLLARYYGIPGDKMDAVTAFFLALRLAEDFVKGFSVTFSGDEGGPKRAGRPKSADPEFWLDTVDLIKQIGMAKTDLEAAEKWVEYTNPKLKTAQERKQRARTIANLVSAARTGQKRKAARQIQ